MRARTLTLSAVALAAPGPGGHPQADFAMEMGAGITAPEIPEDPNPFGAPVNTVALWQERHECVPASLGGQGDVDGDGVVGILDFLIILANWGPCF
jgi:hypothetical protein